MEKSKKPLEYLGDSRMVKKVEMIPAENKLLVKKATSFRVRKNSRTDGNSIFVTYLLCTVGRHIAPRDVREKKLIFFSIP
jgi:hypothetical protein